MGRRALVRLGLLLVALAAVQPGVAADAGRAGIFRRRAPALSCVRCATASARLNATVTPLPRLIACCQPAAAAQFDEGVPARRRGFGQAAFQARARPHRSAWLRRCSQLGRGVTRRCKRPQAAGLCACLGRWRLVALLGRCALSFGRLSLAVSAGPSLSGLVLLASAAAVGSGGGVSGSCSLRGWVLARVLGVLVLARGHR